MDSSKDMAFAIVSVYMHSEEIPLRDLPIWNFNSRLIFCAVSIVQLYLDNAKLPASQILNNARFGHRQYVFRHVYVLLNFNSWILKYDTSGFWSRVNQFTRETSTLSLRGKSTPNWSNELKKKLNTFSTNTKNAVDYSEFFFTVLHFLYTHTLSLSPL